MGNVILLCDGCHTFIDTHPARPNTRSGQRNLCESHGHGRFEPPLCPESAAPRQPRSLEEERLCWKHGDWHLGPYGGVWPTEIGHCTCGEEAREAASA